MIKTIVSSTLVIALMGAVLGFTSVARADDKKAEKLKHMETKGTIESVDTKAGTITIKNNHESKTYFAAADIQFTHGTKKVAITIAELKVGDRVTIHYTDEGGKLMAHKVGRVENKPN